MDAGAIAQVGTIIPRTRRRGSRAKFEPRDGRLGGESKPDLRPRNTTYEPPLLHRVVKGKDALPVGVELGPHATLLLLRLIFKLLLVLPQLSPPNHLNWNNY